MLLWVRRIGFGCPVVPEVECNPQKSAKVMTVLRGVGSGSAIKKKRGMTLQKQGCC